MGARANIVVKQYKEDAAEIFLYGHWSGSEIHTDLQKALKKAPDRWTDPTYLTRVIFQAMVRDDKGTTGFGIGTSIGDNEHALLCVNAPEQQVSLQSEDRSQTFKAWSFSEFAAMELPKSYGDLERSNGARK